MKYNNFKETERVIEKRDEKLFGIQIIPHEMINDMQILSGMGKNHSVEYQLHYTNLVATIKDMAFGDELRIAIPLSCYNYKQGVSGSAIKFDLKDVENKAKSKESILIEDKKMKEFLNTELAKYLSSMGATFEIVQLNSIHKHPSGVNGFSGTDYQSDITNPGVVFPLSIGVDIPNFASIIQHTHEGSGAKLIHTEYRVFDCQTEKDNKVYRRGTCLTIVPGFEFEKIEPKIRTLNQRLFGIKLREEHQLSDLEDAHYLDSDYEYDEGELTNTVNQIMERYNLDNFIPSTVLIDKENIEPISKYESSRGIKNKYECKGWWDEEETSDYLTLQEHIPDKPAINYNIELDQKYMKNLLVKMLSIMPVELLSGYAEIYLSVHGNNTSNTEMAVKIVDEVMEYWTDSTIEDVIISSTLKSNASRKEIMSKLSSLFMSADLAKIFIARTNKELLIAESLLN